MVDFNHSLENGGNQTNFFFDAYFSPVRFGLESFFALLGVTFNLFALIILQCARKNNVNAASSYHILFGNMTVVNALTSGLAWFTNNMLYFSMDLTLCPALIYMVSGSFVLSTFGIISTVNMFGFALAQYWTICSPLQAVDTLKPVRIYTCLACAWIIALICQGIPFIFALRLITNGNCTLLDANRATTTAVSGYNVAVSIMSFIYFLTVIICLKIYSQVKKLEKNIVRCRFVQNVQGEKKTLITTLILLVMLLIFFLPYTTVYLLTLNYTKSHLIHNRVVIYYMNFLPYVKYITDPLIYGARMKETKHGLRHFVIKCCGRKCSDYFFQDSYISQQRRASIWSGTGEHLPLKFMRTLSLDVKE